MTTRVDEFRFNSSKAPKLDSNGFLDIPEIVASTAGVFIYRENGKTVRELKSIEELSNQESLDSLKMVDISIEHKGGFLTPENSKDLGVGSVGDNIRMNGNQVLVAGKVKSKEGIDAVQKQGLHKISPGYNCKIVYESGVDKDFGPYDRKQTNIRYNHITLTLQGREPDASIRLNSDAYMVEEPNPQSEKKPMRLKKDIQAFEVGKARFNGATINIEQDQLEEFVHLNQSIKEFKDQATEIHQELETKLNTLEDLKTKEVEAKDKEIERLNSELAEAKERPEVLAVAKERLNASDFEKIQTQTVEEIKKAVMVQSGIEESRFNSEGFHLETAWQLVKAQKQEKKPDYAAPDYSDSRFNNNTQSEKDVLAGLQI